jgi:hypothetical protein
MLTLTLPTIEIIILPPGAPHRWVGVIHRKEKSA